MKVILGFGFGQFLWAHWQLILKMVIKFRIQQKAEKFDDCLEDR